MEHTITSILRRHRQPAQAFLAEAIPQVQVARAVFLTIQVVVHARVNDTVSRVVGIESNWIVGVRDVDIRMIRVVIVQASLSMSRKARDVTGSS